MNARSYWLIRDGVSAISVINNLGFDLIKTMRPSYKKASYANGANLIGSFVADGYSNFVSTFVDIVTGTITSLNSEYGRLRSGANFSSSSVSNGL